MAATDTDPRPDLPMIPIADRPAFARTMLAVWRLHHLVRGEDVSVNIHAGEWPEGVPREVAGVPVVDWDKCRSGDVWVIGRKGDVWVTAYQLAVSYIADWPAQEIAITSAYVEVKGGGAPLTVWLHPSPETGEVPMWQVPSGR